MAQPFMEAVKAKQFECAEAIATKKYASLVSAMMVYSHRTSVCFMVLFSSKDEMCGAAQQSDLQVLVHSIKELQKAVRIIHFVPHT